MKLAAKVRALNESACRAWFGIEEQCLAVLLEVPSERGLTCVQCSG